MKEIDFLPEWYKSARRRRAGYRVQYAVMLCVFTAMIGWSFFTAKSVSDAQALTAQQELLPAQSQALEECAQIQAKLSVLGKQTATLSKLDTKLNIADVLAELSFLVDSKIILTELDMQAEGFDDNSQSGSSAGLVRIAKTSQSVAGDDVRFKVVLRGMACDAGDVAGLICKLEQSPYLCRVMPGFSRTTKIKDRQVSEFEIGCYIANYKEVKQ